MLVMTYQGFTANAHFSEEDKLFVGHLMGIRDIVGFHAVSKRGLQAAFEEAVVDYMETCARLGRMQ